MKIILENMTFYRYEQVIGTIGNAIKADFTTTIYKKDSSVITLNKTLIDVNVWLKHDVIKYGEVYDSDLPYKIEIEWKDKTDDDEEDEEEE